MTTLEDLGYNSTFEKFRKDNDLTGFATGRVIAEHKERYIVTTGENYYEAEITGNLRFTATGREDFPAVGDWVSITVYDSDLAIIHKVLPRFSVLKRQAVGQFGEVQIIAANIDYAFIIQAVDRDYSINRLERYLTICNTAFVRPIIVISKTDLIDADRLAGIMTDIDKRIKDIPVIAISNESHDGYDRLRATIEKGKTYCMLGSSGVGKSTLLNNLSGRSVMKTDEISQSTNRGKHVTSHRELILLEDGGLLIDNPGMREVGITDSAGGLELTFDTIMSYSRNCRFKDCTHTNEAGCAVREAVENGNLDPATYANYLKMEKEKAHFETSVAERRKKEKIFGRILKDYYKKDIKQRRS